MRLNMWARLGIVATGLWLIGGTLYFHIATMNQRHDFASHLEQSCLDGYDSLEKEFPNMDYSKERERCVTDSLRYLQSEPPASAVLKEALAASAILAAVAWIVAGIAIVAIRWVLKGRDRAV